MEILLLDTQQVVSEFEFRALYPDTSFPQVLSKEILEDFNAVAIMEGPQAVPTTPYEYSYRNGIQEINGKWFTKYEVGPVFTDNDEQTAEEQELAYKAQVDERYAVGVRQTRNELLKESDWTQVADAPVNKEAWATYRQALRDITAQSTFPFNIEYPVKPS
jgi:hypothetical protein